MTADQIEVGAKQQQCRQLTAIDAQKQSNVSEPYAGINHAKSSCMQPCFAAAAVSQQ